MVNPGGPGASGVDYAANAETYFGAEVRAAYDIVGFDPRGVGASAPVDCLSDDRLDAMIAADPDPDTARSREGLRLLGELGQGCLDKSGDLARHVSTEEAARDMDVLRAALGEKQLTYFGASYGTFLGATYADLFPSRVGRMVLDGAVDPALGQVAQGLAHAKSFETALRAYVSDCVDGRLLPRRRRRRWRWVRSGRSSTRRTRSPCRPRVRATLTEGLAVLGIWLPLYSRASWLALDQGLEAALQGDGTLLLNFADQYVGRGADGYSDNSSEAIYAVTCLDYDESIRLKDVRRLEPRFEKASPTFGRIFAFGTAACDRVARADRQEAACAAREGGRADPGHRHLARPRHAAGLGPGAGPPARVRGAGHPRRRRPHGVPGGEHVRRRHPRGVPRLGHGARRRRGLLSPVFTAGAGGPYTRPAWPSRGIPDLDHEAALAQSVERFTRNE